jgi:hypothetical protein
MAGWCWWASVTTVVGYVAAKLQKISKDGKSGAGGEKCLLAY